MATVRRVVAPNPSPFTGPGTNTWVLGDGPALIVIDPGPDDEDHLAALQRAVAANAVGVVLVTHGHADHLELAERFGARADRARVCGRAGAGGRAGAAPARGRDDATGASAQAGRRGAGRRARGSVLAGLTANIGMDYSVLLRWGR